MIKLLIMMKGMISLLTIPWDQELIQLLVQVLVQMMKGAF